MDQEKEKNILDHLDDLRFFPRVRGPHLGSSGTKRTANHGPERRKHGRRRGPISGLLQSQQGSSGHVCNLHGFFELEKLRGAYFNVLSNGVKVCESSIEK